MPTYGYMTRDDLVAMLSAMASEHPRGLTGIAEKYGLSVPYLSQVISRQNSIGPKILQVLGVEKVVVYRRVIPERDPAANQTCE